MDLDSNALRDEKIEKIRELRSKARRARQLAILPTDEMTINNLTSYAKELEAQAATLEAELGNASSAQTPASVPSGEPSTTEARLAFNPEEGKADKPPGGDDT
jgi:hypothetical protein